MKLHCTAAQGGRGDVALISSQEIRLSSFRQIIVDDVELVRTSWGYAVPQSICFTAPELTLVSHVSGVRLFNSQVC